MTDIIKLDMTDIWASGGDKVAPAPAKIAQGWLVEAVPRQTWNWFENRQDQNIAYLLQKGFPEWDNYTEFLANKSWINRNGIIYKAILTGINKDPVSQPTYWVKAFPESSASLEAVRVLTPAADRLPYYTSSSAAALATFTAFARTLLDDVDAATMRTTLGAQASDATLTALAGVTATINKLPYFNGTDTATVTDLTAFGRSLIDDADATAGRTTLDLITQATSDDATVNRVMKTGAFGLGTGTVTTITTLSTFSQYTPSGFYRCTGLSTAGCPFAANDTGMVIAITTATNLTLYIVTQYNTRRTWTANYFSGVLSAWVESSPVDSPNFTGTPTVPTATLNNDSSQVANTAFVNDALVNVGLGQAASAVSLSPGTDLNNVKRSGLFGQGANVNATLILNYPIALAGTLLVQMAGPSITSQTYIVHSTGEMYVRSFYVTWSEWRKVFDSVNTTALAQSFLTASTDTAARSVLLAAKSGANTDITSLTDVDLTGTTTVTGVVTLNNAVNESIVSTASAATVSIATLASNVIALTGTTTITSFGAGVAGTRRQVRFTTALTLTHNAVSMILPGAANIVTAINDTAEFLSLGSSNWVCTMYNRASGQPTTTISVAQGGTGVTTSTGTGSVVLSVSPTFTGAPLAPTATAGTSTTQIATTAFTTGAITTSAATKQPLDATLTALAGLATGANFLAYSTGTDTFAQTSLTAFARTLLDDVDAATMRATLGANSATNLTTGTIPLARLPVDLVGINVVPTDSTTGAATMPAGVTSGRPASPTAGMLRYNNETNEFEGYQNGSWAGIGGGNPLFTVLWWPSRTAIPGGYVPADGQTLARATYQAAWGRINAGDVPLATEAAWLTAQSTWRGCYTVGNGTTTFRVPDLNGQSSGSMGSAFLRGDGLNSAGTNGLLQASQNLSHSHTVATDVAGTLGALSASGGTAFNAANRLQYLGTDSTGNYPLYASIVGSGGTEARPINATGVWVIKLIGGATAASQEDASIAVAALDARVSVLSGRNRIINGDCIINQRGTNPAVGAGVTAFGGADRFKAANGANGQFTQAATTIVDPDTGAARCGIKQTVNTAVTLLTTTNYWSGIGQIIEGINCYDLLGTPIVISFLFQSNISGTFTVALGDSGSQCYVNTFTAVANTPVKVSFTTTIPSNAAITSSNGVGLFLRVGGLNAGNFQTATLGTWQVGNFVAATTNTNWGATVNNFIAIADLQLEQGSVATPFERRSYGEQLELCQRYFERVGGTTNGGTYYVYNVYKVTKRTPPSLSLYSGNANGASWDTGTSGENSFRMPSGVTSGAGASDFVMSADCEL